jgi:alpha-ketoglutarate-dependent taurine dioxygenase
MTSQGDTIEYLLNPKDSFLLTIESRDNTLNLPEWVGLHQPRIRKALTDHGAILLRGLYKTADFEQVMKTLFGDENLLGSCSGRMALRERVSEKVFLSSILPKEGGILPHFEMSYMTTSPHFIAFYCDQAPLFGGSTPVYNGRGMLRSLSQKTMEMCEHEGITYHRTYHQDQSVFNWGNTWQKAFDTEDKNVVESFCRENNFEYSWSPNGDLKTKNHAQGVIHHPVTGEKLFFNYALATCYSGQQGVSPSLQAFSSFLKPDTIRFVTQLGHNDVPYHTTWGKSGNPIELCVQQEIHRAFLENRVSFSWRKGDLLILDNLLTAHGRDPFIGDRKILTSMASAKSREYVHQTA